MTDPLNVEPTPAAPAYVSTSPSLAAFFAAARTFIAAVGIFVALAKLLYQGDFAAAVAYIQAHDVEAAAMAIAGFASLVWGVWKKYQHSALLLKVASDPRIAYVRAKLS